MRSLRLLVVLTLLLPTPVVPRASKKDREQKKWAKDAKTRTASGQRDLPSHSAPLILSATECAQIVREIKALGLMRASETNELDPNVPKSATVGGGGGMGSGEDTVRTSEVSALDPLQFKWVYDRMRLHLTAANEETWGYSTLGNMEDIQIAHYGGDRGGHYTWHPDATFANKYAGPGGASTALQGKYKGLNRLLSASVQMSDGDEYTGGDLQVGAENATRTRGAVVVFPSFQLHRVYPVLSGERYSLVVWLHGEDGAGGYWNDAERAYAGGASALGQGVTYTLAAWNSLGGLYSSSGKPAESIGPYNQALKLKPTDGVTLNNLASAFMRMGDDEKAIAVFSRALNNEPGLVWSHRGRGAAYLRLKRYDEAIADLEAALELAGEAGASDGASLMNLGLALFDATKTNRAVRKLLAAIETGKLDAGTLGTAHAKVGQVYAHSDLEKALEHGHAAVAAAKRDSNPGAMSEPLQLRGLVLRNLEQFEAALADYQALAQLHPEHAPIQQVVQEIHAQIVQSKTEL